MCTILHQMVGQYDQKNIPDRGENDDKATKTSFYECSFFIPHQIGLYSGAEKSWNYSNKRKH